MAIPTPQRLYAVLKGQFGMVEGGGRDGRSGNITKYGAAYGMNGVAYCSIGVWWCFMQIGLDLRKIITGAYASAEQAMEGWQRKGWKVYKNPQFMDVVFFHFPGEKPGADHTGFAIAADAGGVHTGEFNTSSGDAGSQSNGGGCYQRYRPYSTVIGYGRYPWPKSVTPTPLPKVKPVDTAHKVYPLLKLGSTGEGVRRLETLLHISVDPVGKGSFGPQCDKAVRAWQQAHHLVVDGEAGPATLRVMGF